MEQALLHLWGDYITQTDWMAIEKISKNKAAWCHAIVYGLPFLLITQSPLALVVIIISHFFIDRYRLAKYVVFAKNKATDFSLTWEDCKATGYPSNTPAWLSVWLLIIADNTIRLTINYLAIRFL